MPNQQSLEQVELAELTQTVDDGRVAADRSSCRRRRGHC